ncbi:unnamed protein product [Musa hybrid cultivar]
MHIYICLPQPAFPLHPNSRLALRSFEQSSLAPMASHHMLLAVLVILAAAVAVPQSAIAADFTVGDDSGWLPNFNYSSWTQGKEFRVGDNLVFKYMQGAHNVMQVGGPDFKACNTSAVAINTFTSGNDLVALDTPGRRWYMCGFGDHCTRGQKLVPCFASCLTTLWSCSTTSFSTTPQSCFSSYLTSHTTLRSCFTSYLTTTIALRSRYTTSSSSTTPQSCFSSYLTSHTTNTRRSCFTSYLATTITLHSCYTTSSATCQSCSISLHVSRVGQNHGTSIPDPDGGDGGGGDGHCGMNNGSSSSRLHCFRIDETANTKPKVAGNIPLPTSAC